VAVELAHWDQLSGATAPTRLTITAAGPGAPPLTQQSPPLEMVLATHWPGGVVDWNGEEPAL